MEEESPVHHNAQDAGAAGSRLPLATAYLSVADRQIESYVSQDDFERELIAGLLFQRQVVIPDIFLFISNRLRSHVYTGDRLSHSFDAIVCASAIHFLPNHLKALQEWRPVLKPGGRVLFSAFAAGNNQPLASIARKWQEQYQLHSFEAGYGIPDPANCRHLLDAAGFSDL